MMVALLPVLRARPLISVLHFQLEIVDVKILRAEKVKIDLIYN